MKHILSIAILAAVCSFTSCANNTIIKESQLPKTAQTFVKAHFADQAIQKIEKDGLDYEVDFANGWDVDFNSKGEWKDVSCERDAVPASFLATLPKGIMNYVESSYPSNFVVGVSKDRNIEVELNNGLELEFNLKGEFLRID